MNDEDAMQLPLVRLAPGLHNDFGLPLAIAEEQTTRGSAPIVEVGGNGGFAESVDVTRHLGRRDTAEPRFEVAGSGEGGAPAIFS